MRRHVVVAQREHGYTEGAQWSRIDGRFRISTCDTSIFFLQTPKAAAKWKITEEKLDDLVKSFRSKHRKNEGGGTSDESGEEEDDDEEKEKEKERKEEQRKRSRSKGKGKSSTVDPFGSKHKRQKQHN